MKRSCDSNAQALLAHDIGHINWSYLFTMDTCDEMTQCFYNTLYNLLDKYLPYIECQRYSTDKPWVNGKFKDLIRSRQAALAKGDFSGYKRLRNAVQRLARKLRTNYYQRKVEQLHSSDPRSWWSSIKRFLNQPTKPNFSHLNLDPNSQHNLPDVINNFLGSVAADLSPLSAETISDLIDDYSSSFIIYPQEVENQLARINIHKAPGPDGIPNWLLRDFAPFLSKPICAIFNASIREACLPSIWKSANVVPVPKCQPPTSIQTDLRPISLLPTLAKILESIVGRWTLDVLNPTFDLHQFGALKRRSTTHALISILHHWSMSLDSGGSVRAVFVDFEKAFDHVDHNLLINKLIIRGVPHCLVKWFFSFLSHRRQRVKIGCDLSKWIELVGGMPQGSWLGPLCFLLLIDDLTLSCLVHKFVDDTTLTELLKRNETLSQMTNYLSELETWTASNHMKINSSKTKEMIMGGLSRSFLSEISVCGKPVDRVICFKLLGVNISHDLKWNEHVEIISRKAATRIYFLKQLKRAGLNAEHLLYFYLTVIRPVLEYAAPVWHHGLTKTQTEKLEAIQKRVIKIIYPCTSGMPYVFAMAFAKVQSLHDRREQLSKEFFKSMCNQDSCLHHLLPPPRDPMITSRLRNAHHLPRIATRTKRYCSFIAHGLANYQ
jgi:hypothetical protein